MPWLWCQNSMAYFGNTLGLVVEPWCWSDINWFEQWINMSQYEIYLYWLHVAKESIPYSKVKWRMTLIISRSWVTSQVTRAIARFHCSIYSCPGGGQSQHASLSWYHHPTTDEAALPLAPAGFHLWRNYTRLPCSCHEAHMCAHHLVNAATETITQHHHSNCHYH